jgi:hypothetical protein
MSETVNLALPLLAAEQAQKHVTVNEALVRLDALVQLAAKDRHLSAPPGAPADGDRYIVAAGATGAWLGRDHQIAAWSGGAWTFHAPREGWLAWVQDEDVCLSFDGAGWVPLAGGGSELQNLTRLGLGTAADATNPFAAKLNNALWAAKTAAEGGDGDLRYKMSKESAADTLSLLFQTAFSGRAEIGLAGDDNLSFKVSADGTTWKSALVLDRTSGRASFPSGGVREQLAAARVYYVRTDGSDANNGLSNSAAGAFLTLQKAVDTIAALDIGTQTVTIQVGDGTYSSGAAVSGPWLGSGAVEVRGENPTGAVIATSGGHCIYVRGGGRLKISRLKLQTSGALGDCVRTDSNGHVEVGPNVEFGAAVNRHTYCDFGSVLLAANYTISGGATEHHYANNGGFIQSGGGLTVTITGSPTFTSFALSYGCSNIYTANNTYVGATTGRRYEIKLNGSIQTFGGGPNYFPGTTAGLNVDGTGAYG